MYVNNANLKKRSAWTGRTAKDQNDEQFQNRITIFSSNAHWAVDSNSTQITNKTGPILHVH
jgi:hypothetical protein